MTVNIRDTTQLFSAILQFRGLHCRRVSPLPKITFSTAYKTLDQSTYTETPRDGHNFSKTTYAAVRNSSRFSTKTSIWTRRNLGVEMPSDFRTSGLHNCLGKVVQIASKRLSVCWRKSAICNNSVAWQSWHMVLGFAPKGTWRWKRQSKVLLWG